MKKFIILYILSLCMFFIGCMDEIPPDIKGITYVRATGQIKITLASMNKVETNTVTTMIKMTKGGFTGLEITFIISPDTDSDIYFLENFIPSLQPGEKYYILFEEGAFGNYGQWTLSGQDDKSDLVVYEFTA